MKVFLDLDRTIFRTDQTAVVWEFLAKNHPDRPDLETLYDNRQEYYRVMDDGSYWYDAVSQLDAIGFSATHAFDELANSALADGRFEYDGCTELVDFLRVHTDVTVLTFGEDVYQRFKARLCPSLIGVPIITTLGPKISLLPDSKQSWWLLDDKPVGIDIMQPEQHFLQVCHDATKFQNDDVPWRRVSSLKEAKSFFERLLR